MFLPVEGRWQRVACVYGVDGKYASYCCNARKCKHVPLKERDNSQELSRKLNIGFAATQSATRRGGACTTSESAVHKNLPVLQQQAGRKRFAQ